MCFRSSFEGETYGWNGADAADRALVVIEVTPAAVKMRNSTSALQAILGVFLRGDCDELDWNEGAILENEEFHHVESTPSTRPSVRCQSTR